MDFVYKLQFKKPHKWFFKGDVVFGEVHDGQAERMHCFGWSKKLNKFIADYYLGYQGWHWKNKELCRNLVRDGRGYLKVIHTIKFDGDEVYILGTELGIFGGQKKLIKTHDDFLRFTEFLSTGKVEPYPAE